MAEREYAREEGLEKGIKQGMKKGLEQGLEQGLEKGMEKGIEQGITLVAVNMLKNKMNMNLINKMTGLSKTEILELKKDLK